MEPLEDSKELEIYFKHYTDLFIYQARQRLDAIRFFFVGYAVLVTAATSSDIGLPVRAFLLISGGIVALVFLRLDYRNAQIVEIDEKPLKQLQNFAAARISSGNSWRTFDRCDVERNFGTSYSSLVPWIYGVAWVGSFIFFGFTLLEILKEERSQCPELFAAALTSILIALGLVATFATVEVEDEPNGALLPAHEGVLSFPTRGGGQGAGGQ